MVLLFFSCCPGIGGLGASFFQCLNDACGPVGCADGYTGTSCAECEAGRVSGENFSCNECPDSILWTISGFIACGLAFVGVIYITRNPNADDFRIDTFTKIYLSSLQVNSLAAAYAFQWNEIMQTTLQSIGGVTSIGVAYLEIQCGDVQRRD